MKSAPSLSAEGFKALSKSAAGIASTVVAQVEAAVLKNPAARDLDVKTLTQNIVAALSAPLPNLEKSAQTAATPANEAAQLAALLYAHDTLRQILPAELAKTGALTSEQTAHVQAVLDRSLYSTVTAAFTQLQEAAAQQAEVHAKNLSYVSHDLRGSLNGIGLMVEVIRRDVSKLPDTAETQEDLEMMRKTIGEAVTKMERLVMEERLRSHLRRPHVEDFDLIGMIATLISTAAPDASRKKQTLQFDPPAKEILLHSDREMLGLILRAAITNALQHGATGVVQVNLTPPTNTTGAIIAVTDAGPGIDAAVVEKVKKAALASAPTPTHEPAGLILAFRAAGALAADLKVENVSGKTRVTVRLAV